LISVFPLGFDMKLMVVNKSSFPTIVTLMQYLQLLVHMSQITPANNEEIEQLHQEEAEIDGQGIANHRNSH